VTSKAPANGGPITVANMSLGGTGSDDGNCGLSNNDALHQAICRSVAAGVTYAVAAGNETDNAANHVPAAYDEVITVSALSDSDGKPGGTGGAPTCRTGELDDYFATFSNFGADVDIAAPGVCILSTWKGGGYNTISGTSMATPHVAGTAALYIATHPGATPAQVKNALIAAQESGPIPGDPDTSKEGIVNAGGF
jgi:subtilisin family serine protease